MPAPAIHERVSIHVFLYGIEPLIWRRFSIPAAATFHQLHVTLQCAMGWDDDHLHEFRHGSGKRLTEVIGPEELADEMPADSFQNETKITLATFLGRRHLPVRILYRYDFGDDWVHELVFEERLAGDKTTKPVLLGGARACPPEDCGGPWGYNEAFTGEVEWLDDDYDPEAFDPKKVKFR